MDYPTLERVKQADRYTLCAWHRFLPSPINDEQAQINNLIFVRWSEVGGFTPEISKAIGWEVHV